MLGKNPFTQLPKKDQTIILQIWKELRQALSDLHTNVTSFKSGRISAPKSVIQNNQLNKSIL